MAYIIDKTLKNKRNISEWAYAGWNTNGNTLGTVVANSILISILKRSISKANLESE